MDLLSDTANFLTRFEAGAGAKYGWELVPFSYNVSFIRAKLSDGTYMCPVSAQATLETGTIYRDTDWKRAAGQLGISMDLSREIVFAADEDLQGDPVLRTALLRATWQMAKQGT